MIAVEVVKDAQVRENAEFVAGLRKLADFLEEIPETFIRPLQPFVLNVWPEEESGAELQRWVERIDGLLVVEGGYAMAQRRFGPHRIDVNFKRWEVGR